MEEEHKEEGGREEQRRRQVEWDEGLGEEERRGGIGGGIEKEREGRGREGRPGGKGRAAEEGTRRNTQTQDWATDRLPRLATGISNEKPLAYLAAFPRLAVKAHPGKHTHAQLHTRHG